MRASLGSTHEGVDAMGRGRQKAKQQKVARQLKYSRHEPDYLALQRELTTGSEPGSSGNAVDDDTLGHDDEDESADEDDEYADWAPPRGR